MWASRSGTARPDDELHKRRIHTGRIYIRLIRTDSDIAPVHRSTFHLESDVAGFSKRMLRDMGDEGTIQVCPELAILRDDLHGVPLSRWFASPRARGVIKRICRFVSAHGEGHVEIVFSLNFQRPRPNIMFGNEQQISSVGEQVVVALHTWIRFEAVLQPQREIPEFL